MLEVAVVFITTSAVFYWMTLRPRDYPPGPPFVPFLGSLPFLQANLNVYPYLEQLTEQYGAVVGLRLGRQNVVVVGAAAEVLQVLEEEASQQGIPMLPENMMDDEATGGRTVQVPEECLVQSAGEVIATETEEVFKAILHGNSNLEMRGDTFELAALNVACRLLGCERLRPGSETERLLGVLRESRVRCIPGPFFQAFPMLQRLFPVASGVTRRQNLQNNLRALFQGHLPEPAGWSDSQLEALSCRVESLGVFMKQCVLYLALYSGWQTALSMELQSTMREDPTLTSEDRLLLPTVHAFVSEVYRCSCSSRSVMVLSRMVRYPTILAGYTVPANSEVLLNIRCLLQDRQHWGDPQRFRPDRFLVDLGGYKDDDRILRLRGSSIGFDLLQEMKFLSTFLVFLVQQFEFSVAEEQSISHSGSNIPCSVQDLKINVKRRQKLLQNKL